MPRLGHLLAPSPPLGAAAALPRRCRAPEAADARSGPAAHPGPGRPRPETGAGRGGERGRRRAAPLGTCHGCPGETARRRRPLTDLPPGRSLPGVEGVKGRCRAVRTLRPSRLGGTPGPKRPGGARGSHQTGPFPGRGPAALDQLATAGYAAPALGDRSIARLAAELPRAPTVCKSRNAFSSREFSQSRDAEVPGAPPHPEGRPIALRLVEAPALRVSLFAP